MHGGRYVKKNKYYVGLSIVIFILFIILFSVNHIAESQNLTTILINEVMYNPEEDDNYNEWIELYNPTNHSINVSEWILIDNFSEDTIEGDLDHGNGTTIIPSKGYAIIADHGTRIYENYSISNETIKLYVDDLSIGNGLGNTKDKLILKNSTGTIIDAMEWGEDYPDVPGYPAALVDVNHSLSRYPDTDTNDSSMDFYDGVISTPGSRNTIIIYSHLDIDFYPAYISKIQNNSDYSIPFAIKTNMTNFSCLQNYQIKAYVIGNLSSTFPATQLWDGSDWQWAYFYLDITTDENGNWSDWLYLRFKGDYQEYKNNTMNNNAAYLIVKIKSDNISREISKKIYLLDMDESTTNATTGGYAVGIAKKNNTIFDNKIVIIKNNTDSITGLYVTEDNKIDEDFISEPGYYKIPSPVGTNYSLHFVEDNKSILHTISNITIMQGDYDVDTECLMTSYLVRRHEALDISFTIKNMGDFSDDYHIKIDSIQSGWAASLNQSTVFLNPGEISHINLHIIPCQENSCRSTDITVSSTSEHDIGALDKITFSIEILAPDLTITNCTFYDMSGRKNNTFGEGEIIKIKANVKNIGNDNATDVDVSFYYDFLDENHSIGSKHYDSISKYQKYPSVKWDTLGVTCGSHTIIVVVDENNNNEEFDESNNNYEMQINIYRTFPSNGSKNIVITEVYYHTHPKVKNEYIALYNPTDNASNISGWYITNKRRKTMDDTTKIIFPNNTTLPPKSTVYITQNASAFQRETGTLPDFEYAIDSRDDVTQMLRDKNLTLSNAGGVVALKDPYNHTIDLVVYGESDYNFTGWYGSPIKKSGDGVVLKRNIEFGIPLDTNTSSDWEHPRIYGIGQSDFPHVTMFCTGEIKTFVSPDCSFETIVGELRNATESIYFNIYEFTNPFLCDELVSALKRGISVNIFLEGGPIGNIDDREKFILNRIANNGGEMRFIVNDPDNNVYDRYRFDHGKYLVIDNYTVIVESCNWAKTGVPKDPTFGNREWGIVVRNKDVAAYFLQVFLDDWNPNICDSYSFEDMDFFIPPDFYLSDTVYTGSYEPQFESKTIFGNFSATPVFSPDTSEQAILDLINSAETSICIEQLYIYRDWKDGISPFVERLVNKSSQGVKIKVILNYNPRFEPTNIKQNLTKQYLEEHGMEVKFHYTNWSYFANMHNKGMIVDNASVLISSINWNENSVTRNREAGIIIENEEIALYYAEVFFYDWNLGPPTEKEQVSSFEDFLAEYKNPSFIVIIYGMTFALVGRDWRKRKWT